MTAIVCYYSHRLLAAPATTEQHQDRGEGCQRREWATGENGDGGGHLTLAWFLVSLIKMQVGNLYTLHVLYMAVACLLTVRARDRDRNKNRKRER